MMMYSKNTQVLALLAIFLLNACEKRSSSNFSKQELRASSSFSTTSEDPAQQPQYLAKEQTPPNGGYDGPLAIPNQPIGPPPFPIAVDDDLAPPPDAPGPALFPFARCGNGRLEGVEQCDLGEINATNNNGCNIVCGKPFCGNGVVEQRLTVKVEECDDGNNEDGDGCSSRCLFERCGNKRIDPHEECDDGNLTDGDECSACCTVERCGNDLPDKGEQCDDGNTENGDGCTDCCLLEPVPVGVKK